MKVQTIMQQIAGGVFMGKVITIAREFGSGGRIIAQSLAEQLKIGFYDKNLITLAAERKNLPEERLERVDERRENPWRYDMEDDIAIQRQFYYEPLNDVLFEAQSEIIKEKAETEDCVIVGRCADYFVKNQTRLPLCFYYGTVGKTNPNHFCPHRIRCKGSKAIN